MCSCDLCTTGTYHTYRTRTSPGGKSSSKRIKSNEKDIIHNLMKCPICFDEPMITPIWAGTTPLCSVAKCYKKMETNPTSARCYVARARADACARPAGLRPQPVLAQHPCQYS